MTSNQSAKSGQVVQWGLALVLCMAILVVAQASWATSATEVKKVSEKAVEVGIASQHIHESWIEEEHRLLGEIEDLENLLDHIQWQRKKLEIYKGDLEHKIIALKEKTKAMEAVNLKLLPILEKNLAKLQESLDVDLPCNMTERRKSIHHASLVLNDYDMGLLDKARAVLDAVAREVDLGHRVQVFENEIEIGGQGRRVKILQVGRVGLYAMTLDSEMAYHWQGSSSGWQIMENDTSSIRDAIEMAEGIRLVGLSKLPVTRPETQK
ncbi:DUF3450 domain-containing protein [Desulfogranum japonicum]|uniref:DUF3450 domain-containing protein n=1 Tax=Desulfogranum japonicum TaxID=231447 RepID=UPI000414D644|nr:DUF3450 domain-containing protein [Desulfogranum japonicum]